MAVIKNLSAAAREAISVRLWVFFLIVYVVSSVAIMIVQSLTIGVSTGVLFANLPENPEQAFSQILSNLGQTVFVIGAGLLAYLLLVFLLGAVMSGLWFNGARIFLSGTKGIEQLFSASWQATKPRIAAAFFLMVVFGIASIAFAALLFAPSILSAVSVASGNFSELPNTIFFLLIAVAVFILIAVLVTPITALFYPIVFFENISVIQTIKRAISLGTRNYLRNLAFILLFWLTMLAALILLVIVFIIAIFLGIVFLLIPLVGIIVAIILAILLIALSVAFFLWLMAFSVTAMIKYYELAKK